MSNKSISKGGIIAMSAALCGVVVTGLLGSPSAAASLQWETAHDTAQNAFTIEVPRGWASSAQTLQVSPAEAGPLATAIAPDTSIMLFLGGPNVRGYLEPNAGTRFGNLQEGSQLNGMAIQRFQTGAQYATGYGTLGVQASCKNLEVVQNRDLPQQSRMLDYGYAQGGMFLQSSAGDASFTCSLFGQPGAGYIFAATQRGVIEGLGVWSIPTYVGYAALASKAGEASELLMHFANSLRMNPDWVAARQHGITDIARIQAQTNDAVASAISDGFWYRRALMDKTFAQGSLARRGLAVYRDPALQENHELSSGGYKWIDPSGTIVTTPTEDAPGPGYRELQAMRP
jgi:hypothetical protein